MTRRITLAAILAALGALWLVSASWLFVQMAGPAVQRAYPVPLVTWWTYARLPGTPLDTLALAAAGGLLPLASLALLAYLFRRILRRWRGARAPVKEGSTDLHGTAQWKPMREARREWAAPEGLVIGEAFIPDKQRDGQFKPKRRSTWSASNKAPLLIDDNLEAGWLEFSGPGGFKSSVTATRLAYWPASALVLDVAGELGPMLTRDCKARKIQIITIGIAPGEMGIDALSWIDTRRPDANILILSIAGSICGDEETRSKDAIFSSAGRNIVACLLSDLIYSGQRNFTTLAERIAMPPPAQRALIRSIHKGSPSMQARMIAGTIMEIPQETYGGAYFNATTMASWLTDEHAARMLSGTVKPNVLQGPLKTFLFINLPVLRLMHAPGLARVVIDCFLGAAIQADGNFVHRTAAVFEEAVRMGPMKSIEMMRDQGRKLGLTPIMIYQSEGQLMEQWGREAKSKWFDSIAYRSYSSIANLGTAKSLAEEIGGRSVVSETEGDNQGNASGPRSSRSWGKSHSKHEVAKQLISAPDILHNLRLDAQIVFQRGGEPMLCSKPIWWRRANLRRRIDRTRFSPRRVPNYQLFIRGKSLVVLAARASARVSGLLASPPAQTRLPSRELHSRPVPPAP